MNSYNEVRQALDPVVGVPFRELARSLGLSLPSDPKKRRGVGGELVETLLLIAKNSIPKPDLERLGTEVKSIPLNTLSRPREWTKITSFNLSKTKSESDFRRSSVFSKLRSILFVPVMKVDNRVPDFWYLRPPFLWLPTDEQLQTLDDDYSAIHTAAIAEDWSKLSGGPGTFLTLNTSSSTTAGMSESAKGRAWWLKGELTRQICFQNLWPREAMEQRLISTDQILPTS
jgi:DNA mismatch repair protein MutH